MTFKFRALIGLFLILTSLAGAAEIQWETTLEAAMVRAEEEGRNILVLITAPEWCGWCVRFEEDVLSDSKVQATISEKYILLKLLDEVGGQRNPELVNFSFSGFPTVRIYDSEGDMVDNVYTLDPVEFTGRLNELVFESGIPEPRLEERYALSGSAEGEMLRVEVDHYELILGDETPRRFRVTDRDEFYFYLFDEVSEDYLAVPFASGTIGICNYNGGNWTEWEDWLQVEPSDKT